MTNILIDQRHVIPIDVLFAYEIQLSDDIILIWLHHSTRWNRAHGTMVLTDIVRSMQQRSVDQPKYGMHYKWSDWISERHRQTHTQTGATSFCFTVKITVLIKFCTIFFFHVAFLFSFNLKISNSPRHTLKGFLIKLFLKRSTCRSRWSG